MSKIVLGLDLGITSIGWALVKSDDENIENNEIIDSGVRIFTIAEHPKDGKSLALPRREARGARRTTKRKAQKLRAIKRLLLKNQILTQDEFDNLFIGNIDDLFTGFKLYVSDAYFHHNTFVNCIFGGAGPLNVGTVEGLPTDFDNW